MLKCASTVRVRTLKTTLDFILEHFFQTILPLEFQPSFPRNRRKKRDTRKLERKLKEPFYKHGTKKEAKNTC